MTCSKNAYYKALSEHYNKRPALYSWRYTQYINAISHVKSRQQVNHTFKPLTNIPSRPWWIVRVLWWHPPSIHTHATQQWRTLRLLIMKPSWYHRMKNIHHHSKLSNQLYQPMSELECPYRKTSSAWIQNKTETFLRWKRTSEMAVFIY